MLKLKNDISLKQLSQYNFEKSSPNTQKGWLYVLYDGGIVRVWIDKKKLLHFNSPRLEQLDLIYKMHDFLEYTSENYSMKLFTRSALLEENKKLKNEIKRLKEKNK